MTWVIGSPTSFGYVMGLADVQVSWGKTGPFHDCLRKVYEVAPFIAAGFSGSVRLGFALLNDLVRFLSPPPELGESWIPRWVALKWHRRARRLFRNAPESERRLGSSIMLMGVRPQDSSGCLGGGRPDVVVMAAKRDFEPKYVGLGCVDSIGSGNHVELYMEALGVLQSRPLPRMQAEVGCPGGMGHFWAHSLARILRENPSPGISQNVHRIFVWRNRVQIEPLDMTKYTVDGKKIEYKMPQIASGWKQFVEFANGVGLSAAGACA
jgi:hypothetical protein